MITNTSEVQAIRKLMFYILIRIFYARILLDNSEFN